MSAKEYRSQYYVSVIVIEISSLSKRVNLTLPDVVYEDLERWAGLQGRPPANLGAFLVEAAIRRAKESGELPPTPERTTVTKEAS